MKIKTSLTSKLAIFVSIFFILASIDSFFFFNSIKDFKKYAGLNSNLSAVRNRIIEFEYMLDMFVISANFEKEISREGLLNKVTAIDGEIARIDGVPDIGIIVNDPMLSADYRDILGNWKDIKIRITSLGSAISKDEAFLLHNDVDLRTFIIAEKLQKLEKHIESERDAAFSGITDLIIKSLAFSIGIAFVCIYFFYRSAIRPVQVMAAAALRLSEGDRNVRLTPESTEELNLLAEAFNKMTDTVDRTLEQIDKTVSERTAEMRAIIKELTAISNVAASAGMTLEPDIIFRTALEELMTVACADAGMIYMAGQVKSGDRKMSLKAYMGIPDMFLRDARELTYEDNITWTSIAAGGHLVSDISESPDRVRPLFESIRLKKLRIIPIAIEGDVEGIIILGSMKSDAFPESNFQFHNNLAAALGSAVWNIQKYHNEYRARRFIQAIINQSPLAVSVYSSDGQCIMLNPAALELFRIEQADEAIGKYNLFDDLTFIEKGRIADIKKVMSGKNTVIEMDYDLSRQWHAHGTDPVRRLKIFLSPVFGSDGRVTNIAAFYEDLTDEYAAKNRMMQAEKLAAINRVISGASRDLNNPLTGIMGYSEIIINNKDINDETRQAAGKINREALRAANIVKNLMSFTRENRPQKKYLNINDLLDSALELMEYDLNSHGIEIVKDLASEGLWTMAGALQMHQVFLNIINNSMDAVKDSGKKGRLTIATRRCGPLEETLCVACRQWGTEGILIKFSDSGPGIPEGNIRKLFEPFFTTKIDGAGLGLSTAYGIIKDHGGDIRVKSGQGCGTTVEIEIPVIKQSAMS